MRRGNKRAYQTNGLYPKSRLLDFPRSFLYLLRYYWDGHDQNDVDKLFVQGLLGLIPSEDSCPMAERERILILFNVPLL
jgi:hypothetical protein